MEYLTFPFTYNAQAESSFGAEPVVTSDLQTWYPVTHYAVQRYRGIDDRITVQMNVDLENLPREVDTHHVTVGMRYEF